VCARARSRDRIRSRHHRYQCAILATTAVGRAGRFCNAWRSRRAHLARSSVERGSHVECLMSARSASRVPALSSIEQRILRVREHRVLLDADLAELYGVETRALVQAVKRNATRFPPDFMFRLEAKEAARLRSQFVISKVRGGRRHAPYVFTEQGVAMLSSVLKSPRAVQANIQIMRAFVRLRELMVTHGAPDTGSIGDLVDW